MHFFSHRRIEHSADLRIVIGLGNPGSRYAGTRHNAGAMVVLSMAQKHGLQLRDSKHASATVRSEVGTLPVLLAVPETFMNDSGVAVNRLMRYYKIPPEHLYVVCDDLDIPFGTLRIRPDGGTGGHNGLKSIVQSIGSQEFPRMRVGVGRPAYGAIDHVLGRFSPDEERVLPALLTIAVDAMEETLAVGPREAMNRFNRDWLPVLREQAQTPTPQ